MRIRRLLTLTALVSSALGAVVVYLIMSVPNDLEAGALLKDARKDLSAGRTDEARQSLSKIVQQYPRTDAAAAATVALAQIGEQRSETLQAELARLRAEMERQHKIVADLQKTVETIRSTPPPPAPVVKAAPKPAPKHTPAKKRTSRRRRR